MTTLPSHEPYASDVSLVHSLFQSVLGRQPSPAELNYGINQLAAPDGPRRYISELFATPEAAERVRQANFAPLFVHPGHYYSPICDTSLLNPAQFGKRAAPRRLAGIDMKREEQKVLFERLARHFPSAMFPVEPDPARRYHSRNDYYNLGDATILASLIREFAPNQIVEVGSGFSSAVMLDTLDAMQQETGHRATCTFVEPYADRLRALLKREDNATVTIIEKGVQEVDPSVFAALDRNDILFLDTTHICRTGSDVVHEIFEVLPHLAPGVIVHFHDFFYNFEYPVDWVFEQNRSWNEIYFVRAFLMNNDQYEILYFNSQFAVENAELVAAHHPAMADQPGGGLWLRRR